jgi:hypothetical protein
MKYSWLILFTICLASCIGIQKEPNKIVVTATKELFLTNTPIIKASITNTKTPDYIELPTIEPKLLFTSTPTCFEPNEAHKNGWSIVICEDSGQTIISKDNTKTKWIIPADKIDDRPYKSIYYPFYWTKDGFSLYLYQTTGEPGDCMYQFYTRALHLIRIELNSGIVTQIFGANEGVGSIEISKNEKSMAFIKQIEHKFRLGIRELSQWSDTWEDIDPKYKDAGSILWDDKEERIVLSLSTEMYCKGKYSVLLVNPKTHQSKYLIELGNNPLFAISWESSNEILLKNGNDSSLWLLNIEKDTIKAASPTPDEIK